VDRLKQEVKEKEGELKQERERLLVLSRAESELRARLEGEADKTCIVESHMQELKSQLEASRSKCLELETSKSSLEAELRETEATYQTNLQNEKEKFTAARAELIDVEKQLAAVKDDLANEHSKLLEVEAKAAERYDI
jgi:uncharacterized protein involved in exopolysaccharide biosynthesis